MINKLDFFTFVLVITSLLNACGTAPSCGTPCRITGINFHDTDQPAYLWTSGTRLGRASDPNHFFNLSDYATVIRIDHVKVPDEFIPRASEIVLNSWLLEIPAGQHEIEILYKEDSLIGGGFYADEKSRQTLNFLAEPNQTYNPFAADQCSKNYFWIEDWGPYAALTEKSNTRYNVHNTDMKKPVVAGMAPTNQSCE